MVDEILIRIKELLHKEYEVTQGEIEQILDDYHPRDVAEAFNLLSEQERQEIYDIVSEERLAEIFEYINEEDAADYIQEMSFSQGADVLAEMAPDDAADVLNELSEDDVDTSDYLKKLDEDDREILEELTKHDENTAGSIMSTEFVYIESGTDVKDATNLLGYVAHEKEVIDPLFVVKDKKLVGILKLQDLIVARTPLLVDDIMDTVLVTADINDDINDVADKITNYDIYALPILEDGLMVGIVTMDDALDVKQDEIEEDFAQLAAVSDDEDERPIWKNILSRLPWLIGLLVISLLIANITEVFEEVIKKVTVLWFFNTMILDMAGNAGTQNLAVAVRSIGRNELTSTKKVFKYIGKEFLILLINSLLLGLLCFGVTFVFIKILGFDKDINPVITALVIALSLSITLCLTGILGAIIPIIMDKLHIDPALASGPLITTINDILALVIYFGLALLFMPLMVL